MLPSIIILSILCALLCLVVYFLAVGCAKLFDDRDTLAAANDTLAAANAEARLAVREGLHAVDTAERACAIAHVQIREYKRRDEALRADNRRLRAELRSALSAVRDSESVLGELIANLSEDEIVRISERTQMYERVIARAADAADDSKN